MVPDEDLQTIKNLQIGRLIDQFRGLEFLLQRTDPTALDRLPSNGKWSARQHLTHLTRYHEIFQGRLTRILNEACPHFDRYRAEEDTFWPEWETLPVEIVLTRLRQLRPELIRRFDGLKVDAYSRTGRHPAFGSMTLAEWLEFFLVHEGHHIYEIFKNSRDEIESHLRIENILDTFGKCLRNLKRQRQTRIVFPYFDGIDGLTGHANFLAELCLREIFAFPQFSHPILH